MSTPNLGLEQVPSNSLQPSVPVNDAFQVLDCLVQLSVEDKDLTAPPSTVSGDIGKSWIVGGSATGAWSGQDGKVALCTAADVWRFLTPKKGWKAWTRDEDATYVYTTSWALDTGGGGSRNTVSSLATSGSVAIDYALGDYFTIALAGNVSGFTFSNLPGSGKGATLMIRITQDATPRTVTWPASFRWAGGVAGVVSTSAGAVDVLAITTFDNGTTWRATLAKAFA